MEILSRIYLIAYLVQSSVSASETFLVVSPFSDEEISHPTLHHLRATQHFPIEEESRTKDDACRTIAGSDFIHNTFHILPLRPERSEIFWKTSLIKTPNNITGSYEPREILIGGNISYEVVFPCVTWQYETGNFVEIFISRQFNPHSVARNQSFSTHFRLVFKQDETKKLVTIAIAEAPALVSEFKNGGPCEGQSDFHADLGLFDFKKLTKGMKLRLCGLILNAEIYRDEISFANNDEPQCSQQNIWYTCRKKRTYSSDYYCDSQSTKASVATLECSVKRKRRIGLGETEVFYIIRGKDFHSYFIAQNLGGTNTSKITILHYCSL